MITSVLEIVKVSPFFKRPITTLALVIGVFAKSAAIHVKWGGLPGFTFTARRTRGTQKIDMFSMKLLYSASGENRGV